VRFSDRIEKLSERIRGQARKGWYPLLIGGVALVDHFVFFFPVDALLLGSALLVPRKKYLFSASVTLGSALGALVMAYLAATFGEPLIEKLWPGIESYSLWHGFERFLATNGIFGLALIAASPFALQPAVILAAIAHLSPESIFFASLGGRAIKSFGISCLMSHRGKLP
jgi:hypothetical protein